MGRILGLHPSSPSCHPWSGACGNTAWCSRSIFRGPPLPHLDKKTGGTSASSLFMEVLGIHQIPPAQGGAEGSGRLLQTKNPSCSFDGFLPGIRCLVWTIRAPWQTVGLIGSVNKRAQGRLCHLKVKWFPIYNPVVFGMLPLKVTWNIIDGSLLMFRFLGCNT